MGKGPGKKNQRQETQQIGYTRIWGSHKTRLVIGCKRLKSAKKNQNPRETWQGRVYEFDEEKLKRIFKKYSCSFKNKFTSETSLKGVGPLKNEAQAQEKVVSSQNMQQLVDQENKKEDQTPSKVIKLGNSFPSSRLEELALQTKSVTRLKTNFGIDTCKLCKAKIHSEWQVTAFDDSWSFLCGPCGLKLSEKLNKTE